MKSILTKMCSMIVVCLVFSSWASGYQLADGWGNETATLQITDTEGANAIDAAPVGQTIRLTLILENFGDSQPWPWGPGSEYLVSSTFTSDNSELNTTVIGSLTTTFAPAVARNYSYSGKAYLTLNFSDYRYTNTATAGAIAWKLEITDGSDVVITSGQTTIVGKKVTLKQKITPSGVTVAERLWVIPNDAIKNYQQSKESATVSTLDPSDLDNPTLSFYWYKGTSSASPSLSVRVGNYSRQVSADYEVLRPTLATVGFKGTYTMHNPPVNLQNGGGPTKNGLYLGGVRGDVASPGITWTASLTTSANVAGTLAVTQLINTYRYSINALNAVETTTSSGAYVADDPVPYQNEAVAVAAASTATYSSVKWQDTPGTPMVQRANGAPNILWTEAHDAFKAYLMFKPDGIDSIYVSIAVLQWGWGGTAQLGDPPTVSGGYPTQAGSTVNGSDTTELPVWNAFFTGL
jgi:hypothetical protein